MSIDNCTDCCARIDTDDCPELHGPAKELLCERCAKEARWCSKCGKRCNEVEHTEWDTSEAWGATETLPHVVLVSECCVVAAKQAGEYAS